MIYNKSVRNNVQTILLILFAIFLGYVVVNYDSFYTSKAKIEVLNGNVKKFGNLKVGDSASHFFKIKNVGNQNLEILNISSKCGCTVPTWNKNPLPPGAVDSIQVVYDTEIIGPFNQSVEIFTNDTKEIVHLLGIVKD